MDSTFRQILGLMVFIIAALLFGIHAKSDFHSDLKKATFALYERKWDDVVQQYYNTFKCSAIAVKETSDGYVLLTAGHCFKNKDQLNTRYLVSEESSNDPTLQTVEILKLAENDKFDYALLYMETSRTYPVFKISFKDIPPVETPVVNANFSFGMTKQLAKGYVASHLMIADEGGEHCDICRGRYIAAFGVGPGASGSAVVREDTREIVGLVEGVFPGFAIGTVVMPMGHTFDDFMVDGTVMDKPPTDKPKLEHKLVEKLRWWIRLWRWILKTLKHVRPDPNPSIPF